MQEILGEILELIRRVDSTLYTGRYKEGYVDGLKDAIKIIEKNVESILLVGDIYYVIAYENGNRYKPYVVKAKLYRSEDKRKYHRYYFTKNVDDETSFFTQPDFIFSSKKEIAKRIFINQESAERYCEKVRY